MPSPFSLFLAQSKKHQVYILLAISSALGFLLTISQTTTPGGVDLPARQADLKNSDWVTVTLQSSGARVTWPIAPSHSVQNIPMLGVSAPISEGLFTAQDAAGTHYLMSVFAVPPEVMGDIFNLQLARLVKADSDNQLVTSTPALMAGEIARDFLLQNVVDGSYRQGRMALKDNMLYTLLVGYPNGRFPAEDFARFVDSFAFSSATSTP